MAVARTSGVLPEASQAELLDAIRDAQQAIVVHLIPQVVARGLPGHAFWPLYYLGRGTQHHPSELARRLGISGPACTAAVDQLVDGGYVVRHSSEDDRRQVVLAVTPKGRRTLDAIWRQFDASLSSALRALPPDEVEVTARTLRAIARRLNEPPPRSRGEGRN